MKTVTEAEHELQNNSEESNISIEKYYNFNHHELNVSPITQCPMLSRIFLGNKNSHNNRFNRTLNKLVGGCDCCCDIEERNTLKNLIFSCPLKDAINRGAIPPEGYTPKWNLMPHLKFDKQKAMQSIQGPHTAFHAAPQSSHTLHPTQMNTHNVEMPHHSFTWKSDDRKMFVGGLSWDTTEQSLFEYFLIYGQLESVKLITDRKTGRSKGFAFIVFYEQNDLESVLAQESHEIDGRIVTPRRAAPGGRGGSSGRSRGGGRYIRK